MLRCPNPNCEGWQVLAEERYCGNCGCWLQRVALSCHPSPILREQAAELRLENQSQIMLELQSLRWPEWLHLAESPPTQLQPGQCWSVVIQGPPSPQETHWGQVQFQQESLDLWCTPPPRAELSWSEALLEPDQPLISGEIRLLEGALWVESLPSDWQTEVTLPCVLGPQACRSLKVWAPARPEVAQLRLDGLDLPYQIQPRWAKPLLLPSQVDWCLTSQPQLIFDLGPGPSDIQEVYGAGLQIQLEPHRLVLEPAADGSSDPTSLVVVLGSGRKHVIELRLSRPPRQPWPGWILIDPNPEPAGLARTHPDGRIEQLSPPASSDWLTLGASLESQLGLHYPARICLLHPLVFSPGQRREWEQALRSHLSQPFEQLAFMNQALAAAYHFLSTASWQAPSQAWRLLLQDEQGYSSLFLVESERLEQIKISPLGIDLGPCPQEADLMVQQPSALAGASFHPEVVRSSGPRRLDPGQIWFHWGPFWQGHLSHARLGFLLQGHFQPFLELGQTLPHREIITSLAWLEGSNPLQLCESRSPELPPHSLECLTVRLLAQPDPATTQLHCQVDRHYQIHLKLYQGSQVLWELGPWSPWIEAGAPRWETRLNDDL